MEVVICTTPTDLIWSPTESRTDQVMESWTIALKKQSAVRHILLHFGYKQPPCQLKKKANEKDKTYEDYHYSGALPQCMDYVENLGIRLAWSADETRSWNGSFFVPSDVNFALFAFDNSDQQYWPFMPNDESWPGYDEMVRGYMPQHVGEERILLYGH